LIATPRGPVKGLPHISGSFLANPLSFLLAMNCRDG
jgi:hypothetical protein